jgi:hypothetical protein
MRHPYGRFLARSLAAAGYPLLGLVTTSCSGDDHASATPTPDSSVADGANASPDSAAKTDTGTADAPGADAPEADAPAVDGGGGDGGDSGTGNDAADANNGCAAVTSAPVVVSANITGNTAWTCDKVYLVNGVVQVLAPAVLTIQPGTTVLMSNDPKNNGNLLVAPGAKLQAVGTADLPVVFTSSAVGDRAVPSPGDWGCVALTGLAPGNWGVDADGGVDMSGSPDDANNFPGVFPFPYSAGSNDPGHSTESSGTLKYVRMEYGGAVKISGQEADHEMLGLYGVGSGTLLDYLDLRQAYFGCLFAQGGQFLLRHAICQYGGESGGFDFTRGNQSKAQFLVVQENPNRSSEGIGYKGPGDGNQLPPLTGPTVYNVTTCGTFGGSDPKDPYAFFMKRAPGGVLADFIGTGYYGGLQMNGNGPIATTQMIGSILFDDFDPTTPDASTNIFDPAAAGPASTDLVSWFLTSPDGGASTNSQTDAGIGACTNANAFRMAPAAPLTAQAAVPPSAADGGVDFFDTSATYVGAFRDANDKWATGAWVVWSDH